MKSKHNLAKRMVMLVLCMTMLFGATISVSAASYTQKTASCPRCHQLNRSYGYDANFRWTTVSLNSGKYCDPCRKIIPDGDYHMYLYSSDKYYFLCTSTKCSKLNVPDRVYTVLYDNAVSEHYTNSVRDY